MLELHCRAISKCGRILVLLKLWSRHVIRCHGRIHGIRLHGLPRGQIPSRRGSIELCELPFRVGIRFNHSNVLDDLCLVHIRNLRIEFWRIGLSELRRGDLFYRRQRRDIFNVFKLRRWAVSDHGGLVIMHQLHCWNFLGRHSRNDLVCVLQLHLWDLPAEFRAVELHFVCGWFVLNCCWCNVVCELLKLRHWFLSKRKWCVILHELCCGDVWARQRRDCVQQL